jgi:hypothetical protein
MIKYIQKLCGTGDSFGQITGHDQTIISDILVKDVDVQLKNTDFQIGNVQQLRFRKVKVNGKKMPVPTSIKSMAKA